MSSPSWPRRLGACLAWNLLALVLLPACGPTAGLSALREPGQVAWNGRLVARFDATLDPLHVTDRSVLVTDEKGQSVPALRLVEQDRLVVLLILEASRLEQPPSEIRLRLLGLPSIHALGALDGRRLAATTELTYPLKAGLESARSPVLTSVNGQDPRSADTIAYHDVLHLVLDGVVDPASVSPAACALVPVAEGLVLTPVEPDVTWSLTGERFELWLRPAAGDQRLELHTRRLGLRGLGGARVEPLLQLTLVRG